MEFLLARKKSNNNLSLYSKVIIKLMYRGWQWRTMVMKLPQ